MTEVCTVCQQPLSQDSLAGLCPRCVGRAALALESIDSEQNEPQQSDLKAVYFGDYEILEEIAHGGMGVVYKARHTKLNRVVALKTILAGRFASETETARFQAEAEAAGKLDHPNIVPIYEIGEHEGRLYFSMRFVEGGTLTEAMARQRFTPQVAAKLIATVARAVHHAHQRGILHRDLKPGNILLDANGDPQVSDFGLAKLIEQQADLTLTGTVLGTPNYLSPEQGSGSRAQLTTASDVFSLGAILYEMITGCPPFKGESAVATLRRVAKEAPVNPCLKNPKIERDLATICLKALEKKPEHRYPSAELLAQDLELWLQGRPIKAKPPGMLERLGKWARREPAMAALSAVSLIALSSLVAFILVQFAFRAEQQERRRTEAALSEAERQRNIAGELQRRLVEDAELRLAFSHLDAWFSAGDENYALAYLADIARRFPSNQLAAERVLGELGSRQFPRRLFGPVKMEGVLSPDEKKLVRLSTDRTRLEFIDLAIGELNESLDVKNQVTQYAFDYSGRFLWALDTAECLRIWNTQTRELLTEKNGLGATSGSAQLLSDGKRLFYGSSESWRITDIRTAEIICSGIYPNPFAYRVSPNGRFLVVGTTSSDLGGINLWNVDTGRIESTQTLHTPNPERFEFSTDGDLIAVLSSKNVTILKVPSLQVVSKIETALQFARFTPDSKFLVGVKKPGVVECWSLQGNRKYVIQTDLFPITDLQFTPDGSSFVTAGSDLIRIFLTESGTVVGEALKQRFSPLRAWFNKDGTRIYSSTFQDLFSVWDASSFAPPKQSWSQPGKMHFSAQFKETDKSVARLDLIQPATYKRLWGEERIPLPIPSWIPGFLEELAGLRLDSGGAEIISQTGLARRKRELEENPRPDLYERFARWSLTSQNLRPENPMPIEGVNRARSLLAEHNIESLQRAFWIQPTNMATLARLSKQLCYRAKQDRKPTYPFEAYIQAALARERENPEVWLDYVEILAAGGHEDQALFRATQATECFPKHPALRQIQALLLEAGRRFSEALSAYDVAYKLAEDEGGPGMNTLEWHIARARLLRAMGDVKAENEDRAIGTLLSKNEDWSSWGGKDLGRNMYSTAKNLPYWFEIDPVSLGPTIDLSKSRNVHWAAKLGSQSFGTTIVSDGKVFLGINNDEPRDPRHKGDRSILMCLDDRNGDFLWQLVIPKLNLGKVNDWENLGLISTPTVVGNRLYVVTTRAEVLCLDVEGMRNGNDGPYLQESTYVLQQSTNSPISPGPRDADIIWRYDMIDELVAFPHNSSCSSPLILGDTLFVATGNGVEWTHSNVPSPRCPTLIALNRHTGELIGEDDAEIGSRILHGNWSSPSAGMVKGRYLVFFGGPDGFCYAFDAKPVRNEDGINILKTVWKVDCNLPGSRVKNGKPVRYPSAEGPSEIVSTPVFFKNRVYVPIGQDPEHGEGSGNLVCINAEDGQILWKNTEVQRCISTVSIDPETDLLFVCDFSGFLHCIDANTGKSFWRHDFKAHVWRGTIVADGKVFIGDEDGDLVILAATKEKRVLSETNLGGPIYSAPIVANGALYIKSNTHLFVVRDLSLASRAPSPPVLSLGNTK